MKKTFRTLHLYLSLAAGLFIVISCITGIIMVFEEEINHQINHQRYFVEKKMNRLPLDQLVQAAEKKTVNSNLSSIKVYENPTRTVEISFVSTNTDQKKESKSKPNLITFVNPYTAEVIEVYNKKEAFFTKVEMLHRFLLSKKGGIGQYVMGYSATIFLFILITGIILWWPKTKLIINQRLKIKWDSNIKRLIFDLHAVTGFYTSIFLIVIVLTGLVMSFKWVNNGIFAITASKQENPEPPKSTIKNQKNSVSVETIHALSKKSFNQAKNYNIKVPQDSVDIFTVSVLNKNASSNQINTFYVDQYSGKIIGQIPYAEKNLGQKIRSYIKPLHTGELFGMPHKILNFFICLFALSFPVTGLMLWFNRQKKS
jgi:uncharacterized iron-regulated membrane protein